MRPAIYVETTVISYLTARPTSDVVRQGHQAITRRWWDNRRSDFDLFVSQFVLDEAAGGDATAAAERVTALAGIHLLDITTDVEPLADALLRAGALPPKARIDALHLAVAAVNGVDFLLTWNCRHLANAMLWTRMEDTCRTEGYEPPAIVTPYELLAEAP